MKHLKKFNENRESDHCEYCHDMGKEPNCPMCHRVIDYGYEDNQLKFLPHLLLQDDLYARLTFNDGINPKDENCFINLTVYSTEKDLLDIEERSRLAKNWNDAKKRQK